MKFTDEQFSAIHAGALLLTSVDNTLKKEEEMLLTAEISSLEIPKYKLDKLLSATRNMHPFDAFEIISKLSPQDKRYVRVFWETLISISGEVVKREGDLLEQLSKICGLPSVRVEDCMAFVTAVLSPKK